jgi:hypothetical protein
VSNVDTPPYQRGVVSAQKLLATVAGAVASVVVGVPPNAETIVVGFAAGAAAESATCVGVTSGIQYAGTVALPGGSTSAGLAWFFDCANVIDQQVAITLFQAPGVTWYVYSDSAAHLTADVSKKTDAQGNQYVIGTVPGSSSNSHPSNELSYVGGTLAANATLINAPGAGKRVRVFSAWLTTLGAWTAQIAGTIGEWVIAAPSNGHASITFQPTGVVFGNNEAIQVFVGGAVGLGVSYTVETI